MVRRTRAPPGPSSQGPGDHRLAREVAASAARARRSATPGTLGRMRVTAAPAVAGCSPCAVLARRRLRARDAGRELRPGVRVHDRRPLRRRLPGARGAAPDARTRARRPTTVDSGRNCTDAALGTLAEPGVDGVRFAGATWALGGTSGLTVAVFEGDGLDAAKLLTFYEAGARAARRTEKLQVVRHDRRRHRAKRLDVLGRDGTGQTIVTWPAADAAGSTSCSPRTSATRRSPRRPRRSRDRAAAAAERVAVQLRGGC